MAQTINVDISTRGAPPVAYTHQGDTDRTFLVNVFENGEAFGVAGFTVKVAAILPGDSGYTVISGADMVSATKTTTGTNQLMFTPSAQYTARSGRGILTLIMTTNTGTPATLRPINIDFRIQKSADGPDVIAGASDFPEGMEEIAEQVFQEYLSTYLPPVAPSSSADANKAASAKLTGQELDNLKSDLSESGVLRISDEVPLTVGGYINTSGNVVQTADFSYTEFIDATNIGYVYSCMGYNVAVLAYYDENNQFIDYMPTTSSEYVSQWWELDKPTGTKYIRFSNRKNLSNDDVKIKSIINIDSIVETVDALNEKEKYVSDDIIPNAVDLSVGISGIVNKVGQLIEAEYHSEPFLLKQGQTISFTCRSSTVIAPIARYVAGYGRYVVLVVGNDSNDDTYTYTAFEDMYIVLSWYASHPHYATITKEYSLVSIDERIAQQEEVDYSACVSRILCIGDSLTAGALFLNSATNYVGDNAKSYPYFLSKEMNIQCINKGSDGATPEIWFDRLYTETVFDDYDCLLLWLGTNHGLSDTIATDVDAFSDYHDYTGNTGKYCRIIEEFKEKTNDAPVFLIKVFDGGYDTETGITKEITNSVIEKIAQKYNVPTIETAEFLYQTPPEGYSDLAVKIHGVNELHFNTYGNMYIAHHFHEAMKAYWKNNTNKMDAAYRLMGDGLPWWMEH